MCEKEDGFKIKLIWTLVLNCSEYHRFEDMGKTWCPVSVGCEHSKLRLITESE